LAENRELSVTEADKERLGEMIEELRVDGVPYRSMVDALEGELRLAAVVSPALIEPDVVTMNSRVETRDLDRDEVVRLTLAYPRDVGAFDDKLSVLTPLGRRLLGSRVGDVIDWEIPRGVRRLKIERMLYQPEAAGNLYA
jgi:regulator of nucleoside diphosphate kinase